MYEQRSSAANAVLIAGYGTEDKREEGCRTGYNVLNNHSKAIIWRNY